MLSFDFDMLGVTPGDLVLDLGCGNGRHAFEAMKRGARVVAADLDASPLQETRSMMDALRVEGRVPHEATSLCLRANALRLPFGDAVFDHVIASEVLEHIPDDATALAEISRVLKPGGSLAVTVPRWWPEVVCWTLSRRYHAVKGGHVRIYRRSDIAARLRSAGLRPRRTAHSHAFHSPYWWLRCAFGMDNPGALVPRLYHRFLVWEMTGPRSIRAVERTLDPVLGKSLVLYADRIRERGSVHG